MGQSLAIPRVIPEDWKRLDLIINKIKMRLGSAGSPTLAGLTLTGLTASTLIGANASKALESITVGTGLDYTRPNLTLSHLGIEALTDPGADRIIFWDDSATPSACKWLETGDSIAITATTLDTIQDIQTSASPTFAGGTFTGVVTGVTPTAGTHLATKEYVDLALGAFKTFFLSDTDSGVGALNYAYPHETSEPQSIIVNDGGGEAYGTGTHLHKGFITEAGEPNTTTIHEGVLEIHFHAKKGASNQRITTLKAIISRVDADGTSGKTTIATSEDTAELTDTETAYTIHAVLAADIEIADTARLICDIYADVTTGAQDSVVTLYMEGTQDSYFTTKVDSGIWQNHGDVLDDLNTLGAAASDGQFIVATGAGAFAYESGATARTSLGLVIGTNVQAWDAQLDDIAALAVTDGNFIVGDGTNWVAESGTTVRTSLGLGTGDSPQFTAVSIGNADTTITRVSAGIIAVEGTTVMMVGDAPGAHVHDGDTLEHDGINSDAGGGFSFTTAAAVTFSQSIILSTGKDITVPGHVIFNTTNSYIGFSTLRITFDDINDTLDVSGHMDITGLMSLGDAAWTPAQMLYALKTWDITSAADNIDRKGVNSIIHVGKSGAADFTGHAVAVRAKTLLDDCNTQDWTDGMSLRGLETYVGTEGSSTGAIPAAVGLYMDANFQDAATVTDYYGIYMEDPYVVNNKLTNAYGIYLKDFNTAQTLNYAIYTNAGLVHFGGAVDMASSLTMTGNITIANGGTVGNGVQLAFDDTNDYLEITGCNVGIGTTTPDGKLDVEGAGNLHLIIHSTDAHSYLDIKSPDNTQGVFIDLHKDGARKWHTGIMEGADNFDYELKNAAGATKFLVEQGGNVGIGITTPYTKLTVEGTLTLKEQASADGDTEAYGQIWVKTATPNQLWFTDDGGADYRLGRGFVADSQLAFGTTLDGVNTWQDVDLSSYIGSNSAVVFLEVTHASGHKLAIKPKGQGNADVTKHMSQPIGAGWGTSGGLYFGGNEVAYLTCVTNASGVIQIASDVDDSPFYIELIGYIL